MSNKSLMDTHVREKIIADPEVLLEDQDVMRALVAANERTMGSNIVDLRGIAMERLEARLDRLEDTHRSVIAAAYENLAGTNQVHRAVLRMMDATEFEDFLFDLSNDVAETLRVDVMRLVLESASTEEAPALKSMGNVLSVAKPGFADAYITKGRDIPVRQVSLRQTQSEDETIYGDKTDYIRSEALLTFFAGCFERAMRRWLS